MTVTLAQNIFAMYCGCVAVTKRSQGMAKKAKKAAKKATKKAAPKKAKKTVRKAAKKAKAKRGR
jgi:hypothetical protein